MMSVTLAYTNEVRVIIAEAEIKSSKTPLEPLYQIYV